RRTVPRLGKRLRSFHAACPKEWEWLPHDGRRSDTRRPPLICALKHLRFGGKASGQADKTWLGDQPRQGPPWPSRHVGFSSWPSCSGELRPCARLFAKALLRPAGSVRYLHSELF